MSTSSTYRPAKLVAVALTSLLVAASASAETRPTRPTDPTEVSAARDGKGSASTITYKQRTSYDFDADEVEGEVIRPDGGLITVRLRPGHESMVVLRADFRPELLKSVESL
jgi:hypothetical protein